MMPNYRDGWTVANPSYMLHRSHEGADMRGEQDGLEL